MIFNPFIGVIYHWIGGLAAASFYLPYRCVKRWSWETYWLAGGVFSWIVAPWAFTLLLVPDLGSVLKMDPASSLGWTYFFGVLWGTGGFTFGLTMRYLGIALGMAIAPGYCAAFGTLMPPLFSGELGTIAASDSGKVILIGIGVCVAGIAVSGLAGMSKERELSLAQKKAAVPEFSFWKGMIVATFSGLMSSCFAYGLAAGKPLREIAKQHLIEHGRSDLWQNLPVMIIVLTGGCTTNFIWCLILNIKNRSAHEYLNLRKTAVAEISATEAVVPWDADELASTAGEKARQGQPRPGDQPPASPPAPLLSNYFFSALAGTLGYLQFLFYSMGSSKMGKYDFSSWTLHMASIIIFSTLWGIALREWKGTSKRTHWLITLGLALLVGSTIVVGYGNYLKAVK